MMQRYLITLQAPDKAGFVEQLAQTLKNHQGHWLSSEMRHISGVFSALLVVSMPEEHWSDFEQYLNHYSGLHFHAQLLDERLPPQIYHQFQLVAYDRPGLILAISNKIALLGLNIEQLSSEYSAAEHTGVALFKAKITLALNNPEQEQHLYQALYSLGNDVIIDKLSL